MTRDSEAATNAPHSASKGHPKKKTSAVAPWLFLLLTIVVPIVLVMIFYRFIFPGLRNPEALDFAQLGRNLAGGRGFTTFFLRPLGLTHGDNPLAQPEVVHGPLFPLCLAVAFAALGAKDGVAAGVSAAFFVLSVPAIYFLGKRTFGPRVGAISAGVFALNSLTLEYATSGLPLTLSILLEICLMLTLGRVVARPQRAPSGETQETSASNAKPNASFPFVPLLLSGLLTALLYLNDPMYVWMLPVVVTLAAVSLKQKRPLGIALLLLPMVFPAGIWMVRSTLLTGNPIFGLRGSEVWMSTRIYPGLSSYRMLPSEITRNPALLQEILRKTMLGLGTVLDAWPQVGGNWVLVFFLPSLFFRLSDPVCNLLRKVVLYSFLAVTLGMMLFHIEMPVLVTFMPTMLVFAVAYLTFLAQQAQLERAATIRMGLALGTLLLYPLIRNLFLEDKPQPVREREAALALAKKSRPDDVVLTDQPWTIAWYSNRPAVFVPLTDEKVNDLRQQFKQIRWLFLSQDAGYSGAGWGGVYRGFRAWNEDYARATARKDQAPAPLQIFGATQPPIVAALNGFVSYPPLEEGTPVTVIAFVPPPAGTDANGGRQ